jgi:hypothetical protein
MVAPGLNAQSYAVQRGVFVATEHMTVGAGAACSVLISPDLLQPGRRELPISESISLQPGTAAFWGNVEEARKDRLLSGIGLALWAELSW